MKKTFTLICLLQCFAVLATAQVASSCISPPVLHAAYKRDVVNLAMTAMYQAQSPDTAYVRVPTSWLDPIEGGIAAIYNATSIPERDSVFNLYCVHDLTSAIQTFEGYLIQIDTAYAWTQAWQNLTTLTGNLAVDSLLLKYDLQLTQYFDWSFGQFGLLETDSAWNCRALIDSLEMVPGVIYGEPNQIFGAAGSIQYTPIANDRLYAFNFEFNDCFDGCDNTHQWNFKVLQDCSVEYIGFLDWGIFGVQPLPPPLNCNLSTGTDDGLAEIGYQVFPNPAHSFLTLQAPTGIAGTTAALYDLTGRMVLAVPAFEATTTLQVQDLPVGIYSLVLSRESEVVAVHKVVVQR